MPVAGRVFGAAEFETLVDATLDGWLTEGRFARALRPLRAGGRTRARSVVGSGSQANLLASRRRAPRLHERPLQPGMRSITPALGFSTTVSPIYQQGLTPVYVDVDAETLNPHWRPSQTRCPSVPRRRGRALPRQSL